jgi:hypothetical protein
MLTSIRVKNFVQSPRLHSGPIEQNVETGKTGS